MADSGEESILKSAVMGREWAKQIEDRLDLNLAQLLPSISQVPEYAKNPDPKSYTPQLVGLGPFHHFRSQLWEMTAVKRRFVEQGLRRLNFPGDLAAFTEQAVTPMLPAIRAQYDAHLDILDPTLASAVALDSLFLLELLRLGCSDEEEDCALSSSSVDARRSTVQTVLINDVVMLDNQIQLFLLHDPISGSDGQTLLFYSQLRRVCQQISPLQFPGQDDGDDLVPPRLRRPRHLLEYLYFQIVGSCCRSDSELDSSSTSDDLLDRMEMAPAAALLRNLRRDHEQNASIADFNVFDLTFDASQAFRKLEVEGILSWQGCFQVSCQLWHKLLTIQRYYETYMPTASDLTRHLGLKILPAAGRGNSLRAMVSFDQQEKTLRLPVLTLKPNCGSLVRNLMAYESMTRTDEDRVLTGYWGLMGSLVRTAKDMKVLKEAGVVVIDSDDDDDIGWEHLREMLPSLFIIDPLKGNDAAGFSLSGKLEAARIRAQAKAGLDSEIQALTQYYRSQRGAFIPDNVQQWLLFSVKYVLFAILISAAGSFVGDAIDLVRKFL